MQFCGYCGASLPEDFHFCSHCGRKIRDGGASTAQISRPSEEYTGYSPAMEKGQSPSLDLDRTETSQSNRDTTIHHRSLSDSDIHSRTSVEKKEEDEDGDDNEIQGIIIEPEASMPSTPTVSGTPLETSVPMVPGIEIASVPPSMLGVGAEAITASAAQPKSIFTTSTHPSSSSGTQNASSTTQNPTTPPPTQPLPPPPPPLPPNPSWWDQIVNFFKNIVGKVVSIIQHIFAKGISFHLAGLPALSLAQIGSFIMVALIAGSIVVYGFAHNIHFSFQPVNLFSLNTTTSSHTPTPTPIITPASSATVSIVPMSTTQQETYTITAITGKPNGTKQQVFAHTVTANTTGVSSTVNATGQGTIPGSGSQATGALDFINDSTVPITFTQGTVIQNAGPTPIHMILDTTFTLPSTDPPEAEVPATVLEVGTIGNIPHDAFFANGNSNGNAWSVDNFNSFSGGKDQQTYPVVQQSDIDNATNALISANRPNSQQAQQVLQGQVKPNERLIGEAQCNPNTSANQSAGAQMAQVTVTVSFTCTGEVYDHDGALTLAQTLLKRHVQQLYPTYALVGNIATTMQNASLTDTSNGTVTITIHVSGVWVAQFNTKSEQAIAQSIAGKTKSEAQALLNTQPGIEMASIQLQGGNSDILPTNPAQIIFTIQSK